MAKRAGGCAASLLLIAVLAMLAVSAGAKKRHKRAHKPPPPPPAAAEPVAAAVAPPMQTAPSVDVSQKLTEIAQRCDADKAQLQHLAQQHSDMNKEVVAKHNKLVADYNALLRSHSDVIRQFNLLVKELEDPSAANFLAAKAIKAYHHPGIQGAVNKTFIHVLPVAREVLSNGQLQGSDWFNKTQLTVQNFLQSYGGDEAWVPTMSGFVVYGSVLIPVCVAFWCVLEIVCKFHHIILFGHVYLAAFGLSLAAFAASTGEDPLSTFAEQDPTLYQFAQCSFALIFVLYGVISGFAWCCTDSDGTWRFLHMAVIVSFGCVYYVMIWTPAMVDDMPKVEDMVEWLYGTPAAGDPPALFVMAPYVVVAIVFCVMFVVESYVLKAAKEEELPKSE